MAKSKSKKVVKQRIFGKDGVKVVLASSFVYQVDIYKHSHNGFNLEDSRYIKSPEIQKEGSVYFTRDSISFRKELTLVGASESWLNENKYTELCEEHRTQKS